MRGAGRVESAGGAVLSTVTVYAEIRDIPVVASVVGQECGAEPDVGIMSSYFEASHVDTVEVDGPDDDAGGLFPLSEAEEQSLVELAAESWEPEEYDDHDQAYDFDKEGG